MSWRKGALIRVVITALAVVIEHYIVLESRELQRLIGESKSIPPPSGTIYPDIPCTTRVLSRRKLDIYEPLFLPGSGDNVASMT